MGRSTTPVAVSTGPSFRVALSPGIAASGGSEAPVSIGLTTVGPGLVAILNLEKKEGWNQTR